MLGKWYMEKDRGEWGKWRGEVLGPRKPQGCGVRSGEAVSAVLECPGQEHLTTGSLSPLPQEERALSGTLEASKALLEEQLEAAQERCARLHETQRENLLLRTRLGEAHAVRLRE